ncbi:M48 family metalloprotease [Methyloprofundus sp.]|uniref:M48 family metalloprotease n=1 Tax=Methyloprofundus sp. TaxID=2020875 RepID=UPI003D0CDC09
MQQINRVLKILLIIVSASLYYGCAVNPVTGDREVVFISVEGEKQLGAENAKQVEERMGLVDDPKLVSYIQSIGQRLAKYSPYQEVTYQFEIVDIQEPNAFALPGGYVYVSRGLLVLVNSEDELAGVIGHEIGHVAARHSVQRLTRAAPIGLVAGITSAAVGIVSSSLANAVSGTGSLLNSAILAPYSREQENDADAIGQLLAVKSGWQPDGITHFLHTLDRETVRQGQEEGLAFLATHPSTPKRVKATETRAIELNAKASTTPKTDVIAKDHKAFLDKLNGLIVGADAKQGVFIEQKFLHPVMDIALDFPPGWETTNQSQYVAAVTKQQDALLILQLQGDGDDTEQAASEFLNKANLTNQSVNQLTISGLPASQTQVNSYKQKSTVTWIAFNQQIFRLTAINKNSAANYGPVISRSISSFHPLTAKGKAEVKQQRLRIIPAESGESVSALLKRAGSDWDEESCTIANNLQSGASLEKGQLIKVVITEPFE